MELLCKLDDPLGKETRRQLSPPPQKGPVAFNTGTKQPKEFVSPLGESEMETWSSSQQDTKKKIK